MPKTNAAADAAEAQTDADIKAKQEAAAKRAAAKAAKPAVVKDDAKAKKAEADKAKQAADAKIVSKLEGTANEINVRFEQAAKAEGKADDHRLAAAILLEEARKKLEGTGTKFKDWVEKNVKQSWETVRKLAAIGASPEPAKALLETREKNKVANKALRAAKKAEPATPAKAIAAPKPIEVVRALKPAEQTKVVETLAKDLGVVVLTQAEHSELKQAAKTPKAEAPKTDTVSSVTLDYNAIVAGFNALRPSEQVRFVRFAAGVCKIEIAGVPKDAGKDAEVEDEIPPFLDRRPKTAAEPEKRDRRA